MTSCRRTAGLPENAAVRKAMAESLVRAGRAHEALALYKTIPWRVRRPLL